jgi:predicted site-specific integrase-resolvase
MQLISVQEYARRNKCSVQSIYAKIKRGTIKPVVEKVERYKIPIEETESESV